MNVEVYYYYYYYFIFFCMEDFYGFWTEITKTGKQQKYTDLGIFKFSFIFSFLVIALEYFHESILC